MKDTSLYTIARNENVYAAMQKISDNLHRVVIVLDGNRVVGTVSDGDIRRAFLRGVLPISPVEKIMNINCRVTTELDPQKQRETILREKVTVLPVIDENGDLLDVVLAYEPFDKASESV
jgi:CBS domain-containing protein